MPGLINAAPSLFEPRAGDAPGNTSFLNGTPPLAAPPTQADAVDANSKAYTDWLAAQKADGIAKGLIDPQTGWPTKAGLVDAANQLAQSIALGTGAPEAKGFLAYHGSPHSFDQFKTEAIGTGEGAQAYGHGLYFAGNERVAQGYRDKLSPSGVEVFQGGESKGMLPNMQVVNDPKFMDAYNSLMPADVPGWIKSAAMRDIGSNVSTGQTVDLAAARSATVARLAKDMPPSSQQAVLEAVHKAYDSIGGDVQFRAPGSMYQVQINANPDHFLDHDAGIFEQSPHVLDAYKKFPPEVQDLMEKSRTNMAGVPTGAMYLPQIISKAIGGDSAEASAVLHAAGIPGIRYLDGGSRADGQGTRNTVIFDPATIEILRKYGIAGLMAGAAAAAQGQPGPTQ